MGQTAYSFTPRSTTFLHIPPSRNVSPAIAGLCLALLNFLSVHVHQSHNLVTHLGGSHTLSPHAGGKPSAFMERFNRSYERELLNGSSVDSLTPGQRHRWRKDKHFGRKAQPAINPLPNPGVFQLMSLKPNNNPGIHLKFKPNHNLGTTTGGRGVLILDGHLVPLHHGKKTIGPLGANL